MDVVAATFAIRNFFLFFNYDFNYKILEFFIIINGVFVVCMLCE